MEGRCFVCSRPTAITVTCSFCPFFMVLCEQRACWSRAHMDLMSHRAVPEPRRCAGDTKSPRATPMPAADEFDDKDTTPVDDPRKREDYVVEPLNVPALQRRLLSIEQDLAVELGVPTNFVPQEISRLTANNALRETTLVSQWLSVYTAIAEAQEEKK